MKFPLSHRNIQWNDISEGCRKRLQRDRKKKKKTAADKNSPICKPAALVTVIAVCQPCWIL